MARKAYNDMSTTGGKPAPAPVLSYEPPRPRKYDRPIALIGCGGISSHHLTAYRKMGLNVAALCDHDPKRAEKQRKLFFPKARVYETVADILHRDDIEVVDIATHPGDRQKLIPEVIKAGKHVLSQKPFVMDLDIGQRLVDLADKHRVKLAVNSNGRWSPHFSYIRQAVAKGLLGETFAAHLSCHWNHEWIASTKFNDVHHIVLYDYGIHWFDMLSCLLPGRMPKHVFANVTRATHQKARPPLLGQALIEYDGAQASLVFDGAVTTGPFDAGYITGTRGSAHYQGPSLSNHTVTLHTRRGYGSPALRGDWFVEGFMGTMGELLCAIESKREPSNSARDNLPSLALCFAAVRSADSGRPQVVGKVRKIALKNS